jgi:hypothetical protein
MNPKLCGDCNGEGLLETEDDIFPYSVCESCDGMGVILDEDIGQSEVGVARNRRRPRDESRESTEAARVRANRTARKDAGKRRKANRETRNRRLNPEFETE